MVELLQFAIDPASAADAPFLIQQHGTTPGTSDIAERHDTVTLSAAALIASRSSHLLAFPAGNGALVLAEFPAEALLEKGYSASQIAIDLGLPTQTLDAELGIPFHAAA